MFKFREPVDRPDLLGDDESTRGLLRNAPTRIKSSAGTVTYGVVQDSSGQERTDLHGNPIKFASDPHGRCNLLPPAYTDDSIVYIPIRGMYFEETTLPSLEPERKKSFLRRLSSIKREEAAMRIVPMSRGDYLRYWAKGADGKFMPSVIDPPQGRAAWLREHLEKDWVKEDEERMRTDRKRYGHEGWLDLGGGGGGYA